LSVAGCKKLLLRSISALFNVILLKEDLGEEAKRLFEDYLRDAIREEGKDGEMTGYVHNHLGRYYCTAVEILHSNDAKKNHLQMAKDHLKKSLHICTTIFGPNNPTTMGVASSFVTASFAFDNMENR
jgi:hypothetical protein